MTQKIKYFFSVNPEAEKMPQEAGAEGGEGWRVIKIQIKKMDEDESNYEESAIPEPPFRFTPAFPDHTEAFEDTFLKHQEMFRQRSEAMKRNFAERFSHSQPSQHFFHENVASPKPNPKHRVSASLETRRTNSVRRSAADGSGNVRSTTTMEIKRTSEEHPNIVTCIKSNQNVIRDRNVMTECVGYTSGPEEDYAIRDSIYLPKESLDFRCPAELSDSDHVKMFNIPIIRVNPTTSETIRNVAIHSVKSVEVPVKIEEVKLDETESEFELPVRYVTSTLKSEQHQAEAYCSSPILLQSTGDLSSDDDEILEAMKDSDSSTNTYRSSKLSRNLIPIEIRREKKGSPTLKIEEKVFEDISVEEYEVPAQEISLDSYQGHEKGLYDCGNSGPTPSRTQDEFERLFSRSSGILLSKVDQISSSSSQKSEQHQAEAYCPIPIISQRIGDLRSENDKILEAKKDPDSSTCIYGSSEISGKLIQIEIHREKEESPELKEEEKVIFDDGHEVAERELPSVSCQPSTRSTPEGATALLSPDKTEELFTDSSEVLAKEMALSENIEKDVSKVDPISTFEQTYETGFTNVQDFVDLSEFEIVKSPFGSSEDLLLEEVKLETEIVSTAKIFMTEFAQISTSAERRLNEDEEMEFEEVRMVDPEVKTAIIHTKTEEDVPGEIYF